VLSDYAKQILISAERAAHLTQSLLAFSRKQIIDLRPIDVNAVVGQVKKLLARVIGEDIEFTTDPSSDDLTVLADSVQLEQVLMNLATNARDAMPNGGVLTIKTDTFEMDEDFLRIHGYGRPGTYVRVIVSDTGAGMAEETRAKIFEPFFTTKEVGKGTGLGLAMAYGIIKQHNGYINVSSEPGKGATFKAYLPLIVHTPPPVAWTPRPFLMGGTETVLLAEDDGAVRGLMRTVLEGYGYRVIEAVDGEDGIRQFRKNADVDLIVSDMVMPKMNGAEMYQEIKKARPDIKALFMSGYPAVAANTKSVQETGLDLLLKPVSPAVLLLKVREALDGVNGAGNEGIS
jgi:CheY-like chemotaxis protein